MIINHSMQIDLKQKGYGPVIHAVQGDANSRVLRLELLDQGAPWTVPEGVTPSLAYMQLLSGGSGWYDTLPDGAAACTIQGNTVTAVLVPQLLDGVGTVAAAIVFRDDELNQLSTFRFQILLEPNPAADSTISNEYYNLVTLSQINEAVEAVNQRVELVEGLLEEVGQSARYYVPAVTQPADGTARFAFAASEEDMPAVPPVELVLPAGPQGEPGAAGAAATFEFTGVTELAYGEAPTVAEEDGSTAQNRKYKLGIPQGAPPGSGTLRFTGAVEAAYNGSEDVEVHMDWVGIKTSNPITGVLLEETTLSGGFTSKITYAMLEGNTELAVTCDGRLFVCVPEFGYSEGDGYYVHVGNKHLFSSSQTDTGEPFFIMGYKGGTNSILNFSSAGEHTMSIYGYKERFEYNKLPEEYLPESVVRSVNGVAPDESGNVNISGSSDSGQNVDLTGYAKTEDIPTKVSQLENDSGYLTEHQDISGKADTVYVDKQIAGVKADIVQQTPLFAETVDGCTDTASLYVLPDGYIYGYMQGTSAQPAITYEEEAYGYWRREGNFISLDSSYNFISKRTKNIPVMSGDKLRYRGFGDGSGGSQSVIWLDANSGLLSFESFNANTAPVEVVAPENAAFVWFHSHNNYSGESPTLEVSWVLCQAASEYQWCNTGHAFVPADYEDRIIALENTAAAHDETDADHEERIADTEKKVADLVGQNLNSRVNKVEQSVTDLFTNAVIVDKPVEFEWASTTAFASGSVGSTPKANEAGEGYGYTCIPVSEGEVYTIIGAHAWQSFCWALTDANAVILSMSENPSGGDTPIEAEIAVPADAKYLYFNYYGFRSLTKKTAVPTAIEDILFNKKIIYEGDSIAESRGNNGGGYAKIIADLTYGKYDNQAVGGGILRTRNGIQTTSAHSVVDNLPNLPKDADLYCFEGGINDYWGNATLGTYTLNDFAGELDATTICGALETIFRYALNNFPGKPVCFVITHKIQETAYRNNGSGNTFKEYRDAMVGICEKYSIPYYDAFSESGLNGWNDAQNNLYLNSNSTGTADGCHPNAEGYKRYYVPQLLALFRRIMPVE